MSRRIIVALMASVAFVTIPLANNAMAFGGGRGGGGGHFGGGGGHFGGGGGGHFGGGHFGGGHFGGGHFGGGHFGGGHFGGGHFGGGHFGGGHFGGGHFGGGHFGGGHFGGGHFGGGHFGGGHFGGGHLAHGGGHFGGGHFAHGGRQVGGGRFGGGQFGSGHFGGGHFGGSRFAHGGGQVGGSRFGGGQFGGGRFAHGGGQFGGRGGFNRNAFGNQVAWNSFGGARGFGGAGGYDWGGGWGGWGGWAGPVFWPYLLGDVFSFALWPYYYDPFWAYGVGPYFDYSSYVPDYGYGGWGDIYGNIYGTGSYGYGYGDYRRDPHPSHRSIQSETNEVLADVRQSCSGLAPGVTSFPIDRIRQAIRPIGEQVAALNDLEAALSRASAVISASCPSEAPLTPLGRLDAVEKRLDATMQAIKIVRPPLATLYDSLSDEQRRRLDAIGAEANGAGRTANSAGDLASLCSRQAESFTKLPVQRIEQTVEPREQQEHALEKLKTVSAQAAQELRASCPTQIAENPVARLDAMTDRLRAMVQAIETLSPALSGFYASLGDEQKAKFNSLGQQNAEILSGRQR
jgi:LTXXQ motif family protein